jgi:hypothetical protein
MHCSRCRKLQETRLVRLILFLQLSDDSTHTIDPSGQYALGRSVLKLSVNVHIAGKSGARSAISLYVFSLLPGNLVLIRVCIVSIRR